MEKQFQNPGRDIFEILSVAELGHCTWPWLLKRWIALYIHRINLYPADSVIDFRNTYRLDSDLSGG